MENSFYKESYITSYIPLNANMSRGFFVQYLHDSFHLLLFQIVAAVVRAALEWLEVTDAGACLKRGLSHDGFAAALLMPESLHGFQQPSPTIGQDSSGLIHVRDVYLNDFKFVALRARGNGG
jgi:hypothetical protein